MASDASGRLIAIVGATATGKTGLALDLAERLDGEIVGADAMQLYRGMDIGTAKTPPDQRRSIPHHQIDRLDVTEEASVAAYQREARADIVGIMARGKTAILVGGSGLYVRAALDLIEFPGTDAAVRARWDAVGAARGAEALHEELARRDPAAASQIERHNVRRMVRALEVIEITGRPFSAALPPYQAWRPMVMIGLDLASLDARIDARTDQMLASGLVDEAVRLADQGLREGRTASRAVGYPQALAVADGTASLEEARESIALATRQLARRQRKWFRRDPRTVWIDGAEPHLAAAAARIIASRELS
jgi:tRNA dimethylallyltransferase